MATELQTLRFSGVEGGSGLEWSSQPPASGTITSMPPVSGTFDGRMGQADNASGGAAAGAAEPAGAPKGGVASFFSSPFASVGVEYGKSLLRENSVLTSGVGGWLRGSRLRYYFQVEQHMLLRKLGRIVVPFIHSDWTRNLLEDVDGGLVAAAASNPAASFQLPSKDVNAPDLYTGLMAFINFVLTLGFALGSVNQSVNSAHSTCSDRASVHVVVVMPPHRMWLASLLCLLPDLTHLLWVSLPHAASFVCCSKSA